MSVDAAWERLEPFLRSHCLRHGEDDDMAVAAVLALVLEVHEAACWICQRRNNPRGRTAPELCEMRARLAAMDLPAEAAEGE